MRIKKNLYLDKNKEGEKYPVGAATREMILDAACAVFSRCPYEGASIRMIAAEGDFYHSLIRHHFPSKASIFEALCKEGCEELREANRSWLKELTGLGLHEGTSLYIDRFIAYYQSHPETFRIIAQNMPRQDAQSIPGFDLLISLLAGIIEDVEKANILFLDREALLRYLECLFGLFNYFLGCGATQARLLGLEPDSPEYMKWVKKTMMFIFIPVVKESLKNKA